MVAVLAFLPAMAVAWGAPSAKPSQHATKKAPASPKPEVAPPKAAFAILKDAEGKRVGKAVFRETREGVTVKVSIKGLKAGLHGIHVHEVGKCEGPDFKSAGGHFNPGQAEHGLKNPHGAHAGDLPNLEVAANGTATGVDFRLEGVRLDAGRMGLFKEGGTALVIHAKNDDQMTNPSGESGDRVVCGVIQQKVAPPEPSPEPGKAAHAKPAEPAPVKGGNSE